MSNENIFREVDEELRSERMRRLWRRAGPFVIGAAVAIVLLVAIIEGWAWWQRSQAAASSAKLYAAFDLIEAGDIEGAEAQLDELVESGSGRYPLLAQFRQADLLANQGNTEEAVAAYDALANSASDPRLRELALLIAGRLLVDSGSLADVEARVGTLAVEGSGMANPAREVLGLAQYRAGDMQAAQANFEAVLNDPLSQNAQRYRVGYYIAQMLAEGAIQPEPEVVEEVTEEVPPADPAADAAPAEEPAAPDEASAPATEEPSAEDAPAAQ